MIRRRAPLRRKTPLKRWVGFIRPRRHPAQHRAVVEAVRAEVFQLDTVCVLCGGPPQATDEMHEFVMRSKTRGLPPEQRFNRRICGRTHRGCHRQFHEHRIQTEFLDPTQGIDGGLVVRRDGATAVYRRGQRPSHVRVE